MKVCEECFVDKEIRAIIHSKNIRGTCSICGTKDIFVLETEEDDSLEIELENLVRLYTPTKYDERAGGIMKGNSKSLSLSILYDWSIINPHISIDAVDTLLRGICSSLYSENKELFENSVFIPELCDNEYLMDNSILGINCWDDFVKGLIEDNRYHTHFINIDVFRDFCRLIQKEYKKGHVFLRSRISDKNGYHSEKEMGAPDREHSSDGRANARGIRCLYLSDSEDTSIHEVRAGTNEYVSVAKFRLKEDALFVDFKQMLEISPFLGVDCLKYAANREILKQINQAIGRPMRSTDSTLDYIPTQYIVDLVKSFAYDDKPVYAGVEYQSVTHEGGCNIAAFYPNMFEYIGSKVYRIDQFSYKKTEISN